MYHEGVRELPLIAFSLFVSPSSSSKFSDTILVTLIQLMLNRLAQTPGPRIRGLTHRSDDTLSQSILELRYLPSCANTSSVVDNAKVSILVENLFRLFVKSCTVYYTSSLETAIKEGISARENRIKIDKRKKETPVRKLETEYSLTCLQASNERLKRLLIWVEKNGVLVEARHGLEGV